MNLTSTQRPLGGVLVGLATVLMALIFAIILYPNVTLPNVLTALRVSSITSALPLLLVFASGGLLRLGFARGLGRVTTDYRQHLWLIFTISHLFHLHQLYLYTQLGQICPLMVWAIASPVWLIAIIFSLVELIKPDAFIAVAKSGSQLLYQMGLWYVWFIFVLTFGMNAAEKHLLFYNLPALVLFVAAAVLKLLVKNPTVGKVN